jgi:hypothetical protein
LVEQVPPQSTSVSAPFRTPSAQEMQTPPLQSALAQSALVAQAFPSAHLVVHDPPQSTSVSSPSFFPSSQSGVPPPLPVVELVVAPPPPLDAVLVVVPPPVDVPIPPVPPPPVLDAGPSKSNPPRMAVQPAAEAARRTGAKVQGRRGRFDFTGGSSERAARA